MTRDEILAMAEQAAYPYHNLKWNDVERGFIERFASFVAAAEREACAQVCERPHYPAGTGNWCRVKNGHECAEAIRARGEE
jgi:hypothetical protein